MALVNYLRFYGREGSAQMVRLVPEHPQFVTSSEAMVCDGLVKGLGDSEIVLANVRLTDETRDYEADLVVLVPDFGVVVLEVKGASVWYDDGWIQTSAGDSHWIHPVDQARDAKYALRRYVEDDPRWGSRGRVSWAHGVVTPYSEFPADFSQPDLPRWALHAKSDMGELAMRVRQNAHKMVSIQRRPDIDDLEVIADILGGRLTTAYDINAEAEERAATADRLSEQQALILQVTRLINRVEVRGGAGSGMTFLALQQAKQLTQGRGEVKAQRVALLCYSIGLAEFLKRQVASWPRKHRPAFVGTWEEFGRQWGAPTGERTDVEFWEVQLPRLMGELAEQVPDGKRYDAIVVDEAQDFADSWWTPVLEALRSEETGGLFVYSDENQRIFARYGQPPVQLVPLVLDHNLRNTQEIYESFGPLAPSRMYSRGGHGPEVRFVACTAEAALETADEQIDLLLEEGWDPGKIVLLTTGHRHPVQVEQTQFRDQTGYWKGFYDDGEVFYGHVLGFKGLERPVVVLCLNEVGERDRARERLYVGMSRATDQLVVVGDPDVVRRVGGPDVARRLGCL
jgi:hypothetical protein